MLFTGWEVRTGKLSFRYFSVRTDRAVARALIGGGGGGRGVMPDGFLLKSVVFKLMKFDMLK